MITFFSVPKAATGPAGVSQRNATRSWRRLHPDVQVLLFGDDEGIAELAADVGAEHVAEVARNEFGTPLLDGVFATAQDRSRNDVVCFANTDIVLMGDFPKAVGCVLGAARPFLVVGESWDTDVPEELDFHDGWERGLRSRPGRRRGAGAIDYFAFSRRLYDGIPPFAVGRIAFDNWLVWKACDLGAIVADASRAVHAVHQSHDYGHVAGGFDSTRFFSEEGKRNFELAGGKPHIFTRFDATHLLTPEGLRRNLGRTWRARERGRKAVYKIRQRTPWPPR